MFNKDKNKISKSHEIMRIIKGNLFNIIIESIAISTILTAFVVLIAGILGYQTIDLTCILPFTIIIGTIIAVNLKVITVWIDTKKRYPYYFE